MDEKTVLLAEDESSRSLAAPSTSPRYARRRATLRLLVAGSCFFWLLLLLSPSNPPHARHTGIACPSRAWPEVNGLSLADLQKTILETPDEDKLREWSSYYTAGPHLAGKNLSQAEWTRDRWMEFGVQDVQIVPYEVYINYPKDHKLSLLVDGEVKFQAKLEEDVLEGDDTTGLPDRVPTFHGYSASGNVTAGYVYCNYGTYQDFEDLKSANISLKGKVALIKYGGIFRGLKIKRAQELGMVGALLYSDPGDDGGVTEANGYKQYPDGPARQESSVQRGSAQYLSIAPGDPTTVGYPSKPGVPRQNTTGNIPDIPSIPISYQDALPLLIALNGHGPNAADFNKYWQGGGLGYKGVEYNIGPSPPGLQVSLFNEQEYVTNPLWNVIGIINGTIPDEVVIMGNHRDAWIAGGAGDPNSGSAAFNEVIRSFGIAMKNGWKPLRTIVLASWDGEEYGLIGSTEWVEEYLPWLSKDAMVYLNVDVATQGPIFSAAGAPLLDKALIETTKMVPSPNQTIKGQTIYSLWDKKIRTMGSGSDFTAFQDYAGVPCIDFGFHAERGGPVYQYHSNYDSIHWMEKYGDPGFHYHAAAAKVWGLLAANFVETPVILFNATDYATALHRYLEKIKAQANTSSLSSGHTSTSFKKLTKAIAHLHTAAVKLDARAAHLTRKLSLLAQTQPTPWYNLRSCSSSSSSKAKLYKQIRAVNTQYKYLERQFLHKKGLDGRSWFKHTVFAPGIWTGYAGATFPGLVESLDKGDAKGVKRWEGIIAGEVWRAVKLLRVVE